MIETTHLKNHKPLSGKSWNGLFLGSIKKNPAHPCFEIKGEF